MGHNQQKTTSNAGDSACRSSLKVEVAANYFKAPIELLAKSLIPGSDLPFAAQDLTQAYGIFTDRIKSFFSSVDFTNAKSSPALEYMRLHAHVVSICLTRDIDRATSPSFVEDSGQEEGFQRPAPKSEADRNSALIEDAKAHSAVAHHSIQLLSCIFGIPALRRLFSDDDIRSLLTSLVRVLQNQQPMYNVAKTRCLAMWVLSTQQLEEHILDERKYDFVAIIRDILCEKEVGGQLMSDTLKTLYTLLTRHPSVFLVPASELLDAFLPWLISPDRPCRLRAAQVLASFAHAFVWSHNPESPNAGVDAARTSICERVVKYANPQCARSKNPVAQQPQTLRDLIIAAIPTSSTGVCSLDTPWAYSTLASLVVLAGGSLFANSSVLKMVFQSLPTARNHQLPSIRSLHSLIWRCMIWAFSQTPQVKPCPPSRDPTVSAEHDFYQRVFKTVRQDGRPGVRSCLVYALLSMGSALSNPRSSTSVKDRGIRDSLLVVRDLIKTPDKDLFREGLALLRRLTGAVGYPTSEKAASRDLRKILPDTMLFGSLADVRSEKLHRVTQKMTDFGLKMLRPLTENEVDTHWDELLSLWEVGIKRAVGEGTKLTLQDDLCTTWQALLLVKTQLTQTHGNLTATPEFTGRTIDLLKDVMTPLTTDTVQFSTRLERAQPLWKVMKLVFCQRWLSEASNVLVKAILSVSYEGDSIEIAQGSKEFCIDLLLGCSPDILMYMDDATSRSSRRRRLWLLSAERWGLEGRASSWEDTAIFLSIPWRCWSMTPSEQDLWVDLLRQATASARADGVSPDKVLEVLFKQQLPCSMSAELVPLFINYLSLSDDQYVPTITLNALNDFLLGDTTQDSYPILCIFDTMLSRIKSCPIAKVLPILYHLGDGLGRWISAENEVFSDAEYADNIEKLYCCITERLVTDQELPINVLFKLENFLSSPFESCRSPRCISALTSLCYFLWKKHHQFYEVIPQRMIYHFEAWYDFRGENRPAFVPEPSQSQPGEDIVPPSQQEEAIDTPVAREGSPPYSKPNTSLNNVNSVHPRRIAETKQCDLDSLDRHVFGDAPRINRRGVNKDNDPCHSRRPARDHLPRLPPPLSKQSGLASMSVLGKRTVMSEQDSDVQHKRHHIMSSNTENEDLISGPIPSVYRRETTPNMTSAVPLVAQVRDVTVDSGETTLPSPPCTAEALPSSSQSFEIAYEGPIFGFTQMEAVRAEDSKNFSGLTQASSVSSYADAGSSQRTRDTKRSASLHLMREALEALKEDRDIPVEDVISAQEVLHEMGSVLAGQLKHRLKRL